MSKPLAKPNSALVSNIQRLSLDDGPGIRSTVFLKGCPLKCLWCHNPENIRPTPQIQAFAVRCTGCGSCVEACASGCYRQDGNTLIRDWTNCVACGACAEACVYGALELCGVYRDAETVYKALLSDKDFFRESGGGVTVSGGEPLIWADFCAALFACLKAEGVHTAIDTSGAVPWSAFEKLLPLTDLFLYDIKCWDDGLHRRLTGSGNGQILDNLKRLNETETDIHIRMPLIRSINDGKEGISRIAELLLPLHRVTRVELLPYHTYGIGKYDGLNIPYQGLAFQPPEEAVLLAIQSELAATGREVRIKRA